MANPGENSVASGGGISETIEPASVLFSKAIDDVDEEVKDDDGADSDEEIEEEQSKASKDPVDSDDDNDSEHAASGSEDGSGDENDPDDDGSGSVTSDSDGEGGTDDDEDDDEGADSDDDNANSDEDSNAGSDSDQESDDDAGSSSENEDDDEEEEKAKPSKGTKIITQTASGGNNRVVSDINVTSTMKKAIEVSTNGGRHWMFHGMKSSQIRKSNGIIAINSRDPLDILGMKYNPLSVVKTGFVPVPFHADDVNTKTDGQNKQIATHIKDLKDFEDKRIVMVPYVMSKISQADRVTRNYICAYPEGGVTINMVIANVIMGYQADVGEIQTTNYQDNKGERVYGLTYGTLGFNTELINHIMTTAKQYEDNMKFKADIRPSNSFKYKSKKSGEIPYSWITTNFAKPAKKQFYFTRLHDGEVTQISSVKTLKRAKCSLMGSAIIAVRYSAKYEGNRTSEGNIQIICTSFQPLRILPKKSYLPPNNKGEVQVAISGQKIDSALDKIMMKSKIKAKENEKKKASTTARTSQMSTATKRKK